MILLHQFLVNGPFCLEVFHAVAEPRIMTSKLSNIDHFVVKGESECSSNNRAFNFKNNVNR